MDELIAILKIVQESQIGLVEKMDTILNEFEMLKIYCSSKNNIILKIQENASTTTHDIQDIRALLDIIQNGYQKIQEDNDDEDDEDEDDTASDEDDTASDDDKTAVDEVDEVDDDKMEIDEVDDDKTEVDEVDDVREIWN